MSVKKLLPVLNSLCFNFIQHICVCYREQHLFRSDDHIRSSQQEINEIFSSCIQFKIAPLDYSKENEGAA